MAHLIHLPLSLQGNSSGANPASPLPPQSSSPGSPGPLLPGMPSRWILLQWFSAQPVALQGHRPPNLELSGGAKPGKTRAAVPTLGWQLLLLGLGDALLPLLSTLGCECTCAPPFLCPAGKGHPETLVGKDTICLCSSDSISKSVGGSPWMEAASFTVTLCEKLSSAPGRGLGSGIPQSGHFAGLSCS